MDRCFLDGVFGLVSEDDFIWVVVTGAWETSSYTLTTGVSLLVTLQHISS